MSLKNAWQQQRQQRQQEVTQRQQTVYESLTATRQERQVKAAQLRHELSLFREVLTKESAVHRTELQQFCQRLHVETQALLTAAGDRRHIQATQLAQELEMFVQLLRQQTSAFLTVAQAERAVAQEQTSVFLTTARAERTAAAQRLEQELVAFVEDLRSDVQSYLIELEAVRQQRAMQLSQALIQNRARREAETQALFQRLAVFRTELRRFSQDLNHTVWGGADTISVEAPPTKPQPAQNGTKPIGRVSVSPNGAVAVTTVGAFQRGNSVAVMPPAKVVKASPKDAIAYEKDVYTHIQQAQGARLTEIEAALGLDRFQAVDALRSLIKKGLITQRDRIYLSQAHLAHL
ncbi:MAG: gas vesicle protein GvpC [Tildeniella nuda ZEHNDER 1965/U140]|jgi:gas vesicle GvpC-like protein|nr:gas vesicle protein GvpC [Tildeniella nuda ZEHNDER 1965/U140]